MPAKRSSATAKTKTAPCGAVFVWGFILTTADAHCVRALWALGDLERDVVSLTKVVVALLNEVLGVEEEILVSTFRLDEAVTTICESGD